MPDVMMPRYPVYIPSKGRADVCLTARFLVKDGVPFKLVVEPQEADAYTRIYGSECVLVLPFSNLGQGSIPARNWIKAHAKAAGHERHWQLDDNMTGFYRRYQRVKIPCQAGVAMRVVEDFTDRYENVAISGMNYHMFAANGRKAPPFVRNVHVYSCVLILNSTPFAWRGRYNEDTDLCLQALSAGWCTIQVNAFLIWKVQTMKVKGGNSAQLYRGDGRLKMARSLERLWPGVVTTERRFGRPQHVIKNAWRQFDTPLKRKPGVVIPSGPNEYGMELETRDEIKSDRVKRIQEEFNARSKAK